MGWVSIEGYIHMSMRGNGGSEEGQARAGLMGVKGSPGPQETGGMQGPSPAGHGQLRHSANGGNTYGIYKVAVGGSGRGRGTAPTGKCQFPKCPCDWLNFHIWVAPRRYKYIRGMGAFFIITTWWLFYAHLQNRVGYSCMPTTDGQVKF